MKIKIKAKKENNKLFLIINRKKEYRFRVLGHTVKSLRNLHKDSNFYVPTLGSVTKKSLVSWIREKEKLPKE